MNKLLSHLVVLSLFDGISCGQLALIKAGVRFDEYLASEVNTKSIRITQHNNPFTKQLGDVRHIDGYRLRGVVNLLIGGSPCKNFSMAGNRKGMTTKSEIMVTTLDQYLKLKSEGFEFEGESYLFWEFVRLLKEIKPAYFLLENVNMKKEWAMIITNALGVEPRSIDSSVASAQHRERLYWTNIPYTPIEDKGIVLGDVVLGAICGAGKHGKKVYGTNKWKVGKWEFNKENKGYCLVSTRGHYKNTQGEMKGYTPEDAEALQTLPKGYTDVPGISNTARHEAIGLGWTVDVLTEAFFKNLPWATKTIKNPKKAWIS